jgi:hypothetical protein
MKSSIFLLVAAMLAAPLPTLAATDSHQPGAASHQIELNAGSKWATDAPLRQGMSAIHASAAAMLPVAHAGKATPAVYEAFGKAASDQVAYIVQNCKLEPKADAQLHIVIGELMAGVDMAQRQRQEVGRVTGVVKVVQALNTYGKYFDQPGWKPITLPQ